MNQDFNPLQHNLCETRYFEDFEVGEQFCLPSRTMGESHFTAFQVVSGDNHPIHYDLEHCNRHGHPQVARSWTTGGFSPPPGPACFRT